MIYFSLAAIFGIGMLAGHGASTNNHPIIILSMIVGILVIIRTGWDS